MTDATHQDDERRDDERRALAAAVRRAFPIDRKMHATWPQETAAVILAALHGAGYEVRRRDEDALRAALDDLLAWAAASPGTALGEQPVSDYLERLRAALEATPRSDGPPEARP